MHLLLTPPRKRKIGKNIFALVLPYAVFYEESEKKYEKNLERISTLPPRPRMWIVGENQQNPVFSAILVS